MQMQTRSNGNILEIADLLTSAGHRVSQERPVPCLSRLNETSYHSSLAQSQIKGRTTCQATYAHLVTETQEHVQLVLTWQCMAVRTAIVSSASQMGPDPVPNLQSTDARSTVRQHSKKHSQTQFLLNEIKDPQEKAPCCARIHIHGVVSLPRFWHLVTPCTGHELVCDKGGGHHAPQITTCDTIVPVGSVKMQARLSNKGQTSLHEGRTFVCLARGSNDMITSMVSTNQPRDNDPALAHFRLT